MITGFHHESTLPIKAGDTVTLPKGTVVHTTSGHVPRGAVGDETMKAQEITDTLRDLGATVQVRLVSINPSP